MAKVLDQQSLFSLELIVERLKIPNVVCRFPAVAFRLMDYPTLIIYHVEPDLAETIRTKISLDTHYKVPKQLHELQDKDGGFPVKKGKSCLFKVTPNFFQSHLAVTPLYVMIIDTYPEVPKLIASCSVPLDLTMDKICSDICQLGITVPTVHGEKGEYKIYNLMGSEIGSVVLGHRLLSLGMGLMPHIPDRAITKGSPKTKILPASDDSKRALQTADVIMEDIQAADKNIQVAMSVPESNKENQNIQTDVEMMATSASQTERFKPKQSKKVKKRTNVDNGDIFITNVVCPPPLFYNSEAAEPELPVATGLTFFDGKPVSAPFTSSRNVVNDISDTFSEDSTIRHEDRFSDSDFEEHVDFESSRIIKTEGRDSKTIRKTLVKTSRTKTKAKENLQHSAQAAMVAPGVFGNMTQFPMLNALLKEIVSLQGGQISGHPQQQIEVSRPTSPYGTPRRKGIARARSPTTVPDVPSKDRENREEFLARLATPRQASHDEDPRHRKCAGPQDNTPKNKGWIRSQPTYGVKKTKLTYGMTNTQRLRLAKQNPELLKNLEKAEEERKINKGIPISARPGKEEGKEEFKKPTRSGKPGTSLSQQRQQKPPNVPPLGRIGVDSSLDETGDLSVKTSTDLKSQRRPIPTPRLSRQWTKEFIPVGEEEKMYETDSASNMIRKTGSDADNRQITEVPRRRKGQEMPNRNASPEVPKRKHLSRGVSRQSSREADRSSHSESRSKSRSIEVHLPATNVEEEDATDIENTSDFGDDERINLGRTRTLPMSTFNDPGFPQEPPPREMESRLSEYKTYSEDFETENGDADYSEDFETARGDNSISPEEPSLKKVVDQYSDDSYGSTEEPALKKVVDVYSSHESVGSGMGEEPTLRRVVDTYSDGDDSHSAASGTGDEPALRKVVDNYSDEDKSESYNSFRSEQSGPHSVGNDTKLKMPTLSLNPTMSTASPIVAMKQQPTWPTTREPLAVEASTTTVDPGEVPNMGVSESFESTAYIPRSQIPSLGTSLESTGDMRQFRPPRASPRRTIEKMSSIHTASVSSYEPSDPENAVSEDDSLTDEAFSDQNTVKLKHAKSASISSQAKLGYTWT